MLVNLPCRDSYDNASLNKAKLDLSRDYARDLGITAKNAADHGFYFTDNGDKVNWGSLVKNAIESKQSIPPSVHLNGRTRPDHEQTHVVVQNNTTLATAYELTQQGHQPLVLNFASGSHPGGGFLSGALAQEENLCRSSSLYSTLLGDPMYVHHNQYHRKSYTDWAILSPRVPVFRTDDGSTLDAPWLCDFITCAAPEAYAVGQPTARELLNQRILRLFHIAAEYGYSSMVLGAWGCGAYGNDRTTTAYDFKKALEGPYDGAFELIHFAITDWSPERRFLGPFRDIFAS